MIEVEGFTKVYGGSRGARALGTAAAVWLALLVVLALWTFHKKAAE